MKKLAIILLLGVLIAVAFPRSTYAQDDDWDMWVMDDGTLPNFGPPVTTNRLSDVSIDQLHIFKLLSKLNSTMVSGPDGIPLMFLRHFAAEVTIPLSFMYDFSLTSGIVPQSWKEANVTVLYKGKGSRSDPNSYRDISIANTLVNPL